MKPDDMYFVIEPDAEDGQIANGPFHDIALAKLAVEEWQLRRGDVIIAKAVVKAETATVYKTTWKDM